MSHDCTDITPVSSAFFTEGVTPPQERVIFPCLIISHRYVLLFLALHHKEKHIFLSPPEYNNWVYGSRLPKNRGLFHNYPLSTLWTLWKSLPLLLILIFQLQRRFGIIIAIQTPHQEHYTQFYRCRSIFNWIKVPIKNFGNMGHKLKVSQCCVVLVAIFDIANATTTSTKTTTTSTKTKGEFQLKPREVKKN